MLTNYILVSLTVCVSVIIHLLLRNSPITSPSRGLESLGLAAFSLPLGTNVIVTTLIAGRIWYLSPRKPRNIRGMRWKVPTGMGSTAINIVIESGMLYLAAQLIFVTLIAIEHPAQSIAEVIAVQIYVRIPHSWRAED